MDEDLNGFSRLREETSDARAELEALMIDADRMTRSIELGLMRAVRTGRFGFEELGRVAMSIMGQIAQSAIRGGLEAIFKGGSQGTGLASLGASLLGALGAPGRATGGPVSPGRAYLVGERGPEIFMPTSSGQVMPGLGGAGSRDVRVSISINGSGTDAPRMLAKSARQVARAVRGALRES
ncbi:MAG: tail tape measure protein [Sphingomonadales bacterium]|nr:tail tape measure protein [Sphingomonadales bacterium]